MRTLPAPPGARCEICGCADALVLEVHVLGRARNRARVTLCQIHAAPVRAGVRGRSGQPHRPTKSELFEFWEERRPGILWLSLDRRLLRDRRAGQRAAGADRRRILR